MNFKNNSYFIDFNKNQDLPFSTNVMISYSFKFIFSIFFNKISNILNDQSELNNIENIFNKNYNTIIYILHQIMNYKNHKDLKINNLSEIIIRDSDGKCISFMNRTNQKCTKVLFYDINHIKKTINSTK